MSDFEPSGIQAEVARLYRENHWKSDPLLLILAFMGEMGELASRVLAESPDYEKSLDRTHPIPEELGDLGNLLLAICNVYGVNFEDVVRATIAKKSNTS